MKKEMPTFLKLIFAFILSTFICIPATWAVLYFTQPMEDVSYDLSLLPGDGKEWEGEKGWTVYTDEEGEQTKLISDGSGGYSGLAYLGQTFYFSREMTEKLDSPTLRIGAVNRTVSIFLDGKLIYTDCPELDNRIGYLNLPMLEYDREEAVIVTLPPDYYGQTLTIAQSSPELSELAEVPEENITVFPCNVTLYCGYAYESSLIASTARTILPAALLFALGLFLLAVFIRNALRNQYIIQLPVFSLAAFLQMCGVLSQADFFHQYFQTPAIDPTWLCFHMSVGVLLLFLTLYAGPIRPFYILLTVIHWISIILHCIAQSGLFTDYGKTSVFFINLPQITGFWTLVAALGGVFFLSKKGNRFFRHLSQTAIVLIIGYGLLLIICIPFSPDYVKHVFTRIVMEIGEMPPNFCLKLIWNLILLSGLAAVISELLEKEAEHRAEVAVLSAKNELALQSYENLRLQSEEVMMLRHDTMKHYSLLRTMADDAPEQIANYLDELIGEVENVRPVVASRNRILNILLNGKLNVASSKGISTEIIRSDAPEKLPLGDSELCCLVANIMDNAINAASAPETSNPYIKLDFHCKNQHFVLSCENSVPAHEIKKIPTPEHGYGLKIIRKIMSRFGDNMLSVKHTENAYIITVVIPLSF